MEISDKTIKVRTMARDLATVLGATTPFAEHPDAGLPAISAVQLHADDGLLTATATNRYVLGYARQTGYTDRPVRFVLDVRSARQLRKALSATMKSRATGQIPVILTITEGAKRTLTVDFDPASMTFNEVQGASNAPDLTKVFDDLVKPGTTPAPGPVGLHGRALEPFIKVAKWADYQPMRWSFGDEMKPARVEISDWFVGLVMPVRLPDNIEPVVHAVPIVRSGDVEAAEAASAR